LRSHKKDRPAGQFHTGVLIATVSAAAVLLFAVFALVTGIFSAGGNAVVSAEETYFEIPGEANIAEEDGVLYVNNQLIVMAKENASEESVRGVFEKHGIELVGHIGSIGFFQGRTEEAMDYSELSGLITELKKESVILDAYFNTISQSEPEGVPNDDWNGAAWDEGNPAGDNWNVEAIRALAAWDYAQELKSVNVGVIDSAFTEQKDLNFASAFQKGTPYSLESENDRIHGNHVSGIIAAKHGNDLGISGVATNAKIFAYSAFLPDDETAKQNAAIKEKSGIINTPVSDMQIITDIVLLVETNQAQAINISLGQKTYEDPSKLYRTVALGYTNAILRLIGNGNDFLIVVAAGNSGADANWGSPLAFISPKNLSGQGVSDKNIQAVHDRIIVVGAAQNDGNGRYSRWISSNFGDRLDVFAPGVDILSCGMENDYILESGTSMAVPHVTGTIAMIWGANTGLTAAQVKNVLLTTAVTEIGNNYNSGARMIDAGAAVEMALGIKEENDAAQEDEPAEQQETEDAGTELLVQMETLAPAADGSPMTMDCYKLQESIASYTLAEIQEIVREGSLTLCELTDQRWTTKIYYVISWESSLKWILLSENPDENCLIGDDGLPADTMYDSELFQLARGDILYTPRSKDTYYLRQISKFYPGFAYMAEELVRIQIPNDTPVYYYDPYSGESVYVETAKAYYEQCTQEDVHGAGVSDICWACGTQPFQVTVQNGTASRIDYEAMSGDRFHVFYQPTAFSGGVAGVWRSDWTEPDRSSLMYQNEYTLYKDGSVCCFHLSKLSGNSNVYGERQYGTYSVEGSKVAIAIGESSEWSGFVVNGLWDSANGEFSINGTKLHRDYTNTNGELVPNG
jgi:subtilisin family serine protease